MIIKAYKAESKPYQILDEWQILCWGEDPDGSMVTRNVLLPTEEQCWEAYHYLNSGTMKTIKPLEFEV